MTDTSDQTPLPARPEFRYLGADDVDRLAGLVFELAAQLHEQRVRVLHLERRLAERDGLDHPDDLDAVAASELQESLDGLFAVIGETHDARRPLHRERATTKGPHQ
ncbi:MAG: hypothetical protein RIB65_03620 [Ilumatobacter fluminis]|uniref:hypothetical protein n=1 Tax=Ilumatobacter fluminis TaxID=467091 RepID=UPI0032ED4A2D